MTEVIVAEGAGNQSHHKNHDSNNVNTRIIDASSSCQQNQNQNPENNYYQVLLEGMEQGLTLKSAAGTAATGSTSTIATTPTNASLAFHGTGQPALSDWGYPGFLTPHENQIYETFRTQVFQRDEDFRSTVFCFSLAFEDEAYALCRWLRARKFHVEDTIQMVEEATEFRAEQKPDEFHPDPKRALGVEPAIYISQYPQHYVGYARNGSPLFISKPGALHVNGMECVTTLQGILNYHWFGMMHDYVYRLQIQAASNPNFKRYEVIYVMDLDGLTPSQVSKRAIHIIKVQSQIDSICFPETLHRLVLINAPSFFALTWKLIKNFVDARTCNKVEILGTNRAKWKARLRELADDDNLPADYGGTAPTTDVFLPRYCEEIENLHLKGCTRVGFNDKNNDDALMDGSDHHNQGDQQQEQQQQQDHNNNVSYIGHAISVRSKESQRIILPTGKHMKLSIFTRSLDGAKLQIVSPSGQRLLEGVSNGEGIVVKHVGAGTEEETPTRMDIDIVFQDPGRYKLKFESLSGPFGSEHFLIAVQLYKPSTDTNNNDTSTLSKGDETTNVETLQPTSFDSDNAELVDVCLGRLSPCHNKRPHNGFLSIPPSPRVSHDKDGDDFVNVDFVTSFPSPQSITPRNVAHAKRMAACAMLKSQGLLHSDTNFVMEVEEHDVPPTGIMCGTMSCWSPWESLFFSPTSNSTGSRSSPNNKKKSSS